MERKKLLKIAVAGLAGLVVALAALGSYPWTKAQCYDSASKRSSDNGVRIAVRLCERDFGEL